jgi:hypothetical protein
MEWQEGEEGRRKRAERAIKRGVATNLSIGHVTFACLPFLFQYSRMHGANTNNIN